MIGSPEVNKIIRKTLSPVLKENGFTKVNTRHNWTWIDNSIWVMDITAVGRYFSDVTGWPPMSIHVDLGIYYDFIPANDKYLKMDGQGKVLPKTHQCHLQGELYSTLNQLKYMSNLSNPAEQKRKDLWWIEPDGSNIEEVIENVKQSFLTDGIDWFRKHTEIEHAFLEIEKEHDCLEKYYKAKFFAKHLNRDSKFEEYDQLFRQEQKRLDGDLDE
jgi:hypothetical protein